MINYMHYTQNINFVRNSFSYHDVFIVLNKTLNNIISNKLRYIKNDLRYTEH